jgi:hypothetical protein
MYIEFWWGQYIYSLGQPLLRTSGQSYYNAVQVGVATTLKICTRKVAHPNLGSDTDYRTWSYLWISWVFPGHTRRVSMFKYATTVSFKIPTYSPFSIIFQSRHHVTSVGKTAPLRNQWTTTAPPKLRREKPLRERTGKVANLTLGRNTYTQKIIR